MRRFSELNPVRTGLVGTALVVGLLAVALNVGALRGAIFGASYAAAFTDAGGLRPGDKVEVSGLGVGKVKDVRLIHQQVVVDFALNEVPARFGDQTRAGIKTENALGRKFLELTPAGAGTLPSGSVIPLEHTTSPYSITDALAALTTTSGQIDKAQLATSLDTLAKTFSATPPAFAATLQGLRRLSDTIASRDDQLREVLAHANGVTGVLSQRSTQIVQLISDGNALFDELQKRRDTIHQLLVNTTAATEQLNGLVHDNRESLRPALDELRTTLAILNKNEDALRQSIIQVGGFVRSLGEAVGGGPFFYAFLANLPPTNLVPCLSTVLRVGQPPGYTQPPPQDIPPPGVGERPSNKQPYYPKNSPTPATVCGALGTSVTAGPATSGASSAGTAPSTGAASTPPPSLPGVLTPRNAPGTSIRSAHPPATPSPAPELPGLPLLGGGGEEPH